MSANNSAQPGDMSIFNFTSSSQDSGSSSSPNSKNKSSNKKRSAKKNASSRDVVQCASRSRRKQTKETMKKNKLEAINQRWGLTGETDSPNKKGQASVEGVRRSTKRVSFLSPAVTSDDPQLEVPQASNNDHRPDTDTVKGNLSKNNSVLNEQTPSSQNISPSVIRSEAPSVNCPSFGDSPAKRDYVSPLKRPSETCKADDKITTLETTPKRPRVSPARGRKSQISPTVLNPPSSASPGCDEKKIYSRQQQCKSPSVHRSPLSQRSTSGSPAVLKRNHKGETPLHIASIKVRNSQASARVRQNPSTTPLWNTQMIWLLCWSPWRIIFLTVILANIIVIPLCIPDTVIDDPPRHLIDKHFPWDQLLFLMCIVFCRYFREKPKLWRNCWTRGPTLTWRITLGGHLW